MTDLESPPVEASDAIHDLEEYLLERKWSHRPPGIAGTLWTKKTRSGEVSIAVPNGTGPGTLEWQGIVERIAHQEKRNAQEVNWSILTRMVDIMRFRAPSDVVRPDTIDLLAGVRLVQSAYSMTRAAASGSFYPKGQISGNYAKLGDEVMARARLGHTERGSFVVPLWMPLSSPSRESRTEQPLPDLGVFRYPEPSERRVTRTLVQVLSAVNEHIVQPEKEPKLSNVAPIVLAGGSKELLESIHTVLTSHVDEVSTDFQWAEALSTPKEARRVVLPAGAASRIKRAADTLRQTRRSPVQAMTGPIIQIRYSPGDSGGSVLIDTVRRGRRCELLVRLNYEQVQRAYTWAKSAQVMLVEGVVRTTSGRGPVVDKPRQFLPLNETHLLLEALRSIGPMPNLPQLPPGARSSELPES